MKTGNSLFIAVIFTMVFLSSCYVDLELGEPFVDVMHIEEYETKDVIYQEFTNGVLVYEEAIYNAWLDIELYNSGATRARNVEVEIEIFDQGSTRSTVINTRDLKPGESINLTFNTGYAYSNDYINYKVYVYWD